jgi:hypothetical protein
MMHILTIKMIAAALAVLLLAGCATSPIPIGLPCSVGPIYLSKDDVLTRRTKENIVLVNETGEKLCRWKPA